MTPEELEDMGLGPQLVGDIVYNPFINMPLRDNLGQLIRVDTNGQLIDPMRFPLIGKDARPLYYDPESKKFFNHSGGELIYALDKLMEQDGFQARSVVKELLDGVDLRIMYIKDTDIRVPATFKIVQTSPKIVLEYFDMNGVRIPDGEMLDQTVSEGDLREKFPELFEDMNALAALVEGIASLFERINLGFAGISKAFSDNLSTILTVGLIILIAVIVLITLPIWIVIIGLIISIITGIFKGVGKAVSGAVNKVKRE